MVISFLLPFNSNQTLWNSIDILSNCERRKHARPLRRRFDSAPATPPTYMNLPRPSRWRVGTKRPSASLTPSCPCSQTTHTPSSARKDVFGKINLYFSIGWMKQSAIWLESG
eukprot:scaffold183445_cov28-Prasinocladus_malaysianus.AAC.1